MKSGILILAALLLSVNLICFAEDAPKPTANPAVWVGNSAPNVKVKVDTKTHGVEVTLNKDKDHLPKSVGITFFDAKGNRTALELKAMEPWSEPAKNPSPTMPQFSGSLNPGNQSFVGFELSIPFGSESPTIIRSEDLNKADQ